MRKTGLWALAGGIAAAALVAGTGMVQAGAERIDFPAGFEKSYYIYDVLDRPDLKIIRYFYVDRPSLKAAKPGQPAPNGTTLIMADKKAKLDAEGKLALDRTGHMIAEGAIFKVQVQKKDKGWGDTHPPNMKNGDWEYASFNADGARIPDVKYEVCFGCHNNRQKPEQDFTFLFAPYLRDHKKG